MAPQGHERLPVTRSRRPRALTSRRDVPPTAQDGCHPLTFRRGSGPPGPQERQAERACPACCRDRPPNCGRAVRRPAIRALTSSRSPPETSGTSSSSRAPLTPAFFSEEGLVHHPHERGGQSPAPQPISAPRSSPVSPSALLHPEVNPSRASLVAQWLGIHLPMQGTRVRALVWEDPTCRGATGPVRHNY
ncbi:hypothetical protein J1605_009533 [Eschrichtius robustus]|uniref:Uncharacterized protein n=1 Tax=Eschrichtius robustus TaxID=9764 RepID=A0AB34GWR7_ESCRO|nr:hypothetical protein J1605_009533 [Eschrichtius robustus]